MAALSAFPPASAPAQGEVVNLHISSILVGARLRPVDHAVAELMAVSIEESGQLTPVLVRPAGEAGSYELVTGGHRHAATRILGRDTIRAEIRSLTDAEAQLIEVDENLIRRNLTPHERALSVEARLMAWCARYPDRADADASKPKRGRPVNGANLAPFLGGRPATMGFAEATAGEIGLAKRSVFRALAVHRGLTATSHTKIAGTWISKSEGVLRQLAGIPDAAEQARVLTVLLRGDTKSVSDARAIASGRTPVKAAPTPVDDTVAAFRKLWASASTSGRAAILADLQGRSLPAGWSLEDGR